MTCCIGRAGGGPGYCTCNSSKGYSNGSKEAKAAVKRAEEWRELVESGACVDPWEGLSLYQAALKAVLASIPVAGE